MKTYAVKESDIERGWYVFDAQGQVLGRLASQVANLLRGKHKTIFSPHLDVGDHVVIVNASGIRVTGAKESDKLYRTHSGYLGSLRTRNLAAVRSTFPERVLEHAIKGMLPKNALGRQMYRKLHVYAGASHPHLSQQPQPWTEPSAERTTEGKN